MYVDLKNAGTIVGSAQLLNGVAYIVLYSGLNVSNTNPVNLDIEVRSSAVISSTADTNKQLKLGVLNIDSTLGIYNGGTAQTLISPVNSSLSTV